MRRDTFLRALCAAYLATLLGLDVGTARADQAWHRGPANNPENCRQLWAVVDLPTYRPNAEVNTIPVCHKGFVLSHNNLTKTPDWVIERLTVSLVTGQNTRPEEEWRPEPDVPSQAQATDADYKGSGFDRGHQAPSADFKGNEELMRDTFVFSNAVPQVGRGFNQSIWALFERTIREFVAKQTGEVYVITGPIYQDPDGHSITITSEANACGNEIKLPVLKKASICAANNKDAAVPCGDSGVAVPSALYKIIYDPRMNLSNAFIMPNASHSGTPGYMSVGYINKFRAPITMVEEYTGLEFFSSMTGLARQHVTERCLTRMLH